jgi:hypothetical protein
MVGREKSCCTAKNAATVRPSFLPLLTGCPPDDIEGYDIITLYSTERERELQGGCCWRAARRMLSSMQQGAVIVFKRKASGKTTTTKKKKSKLTPGTHSGDTQHPAV